MSNALVIALILIALPVVAYLGFGMAVVLIAVLKVVLGIVAVIATAPF